MTLDRSTVTTVMRRVRECEPWRSYSEGDPEADLSLFSLSLADRASRLSSLFDGSADTGCPGALGEFLAGELLPGYLYLGCSDAPADASERLLGCLSDLFGVTPEQIFALRLLCALSEGVLPTGFCLDADGGVRYRLGGRTERVRADRVGAWVLRRARRLPCVLHERVRRAFLLSFRDAPSSGIYSRFCRRVRAHRHSRGADPAPAASAAALYLCLRERYLSHRGAARALRWLFPAVCAQGVRLSRMERMLRHVGVDAARLRRAHSRDPESVVPLLCGMLVPPPDRSVPRRTGRFRPMSGG